MAGPWQKCARNNHFCPGAKPKICTEAKRPLALVSVWRLPGVTGANHQTEPGEKIPDPFPTSRQYL
jgi:hypothetical protein